MRASPCSPQWLNTVDGFSFLIHVPHTVGILTSCVVPLTMAHRAMEWFCCSEAGWVTQAQLTCLCHGWQSPFRTKLLYNKVGISPWLCFIGPSEAITLMQITVALANSDEPLSSLGWCYWKTIEMRKIETLDMTEPSARNTAAVVSSFLWTAPTGLLGPGFELSNLSAALP